MEELLNAIGRFGVVYPNEDISSEGEEMLKEAALLHDILLAQLEEIVIAFSNAYDAGAQVNFCSNMRMWQASCESFLLLRAIYRSLLEKYNCETDERDWFTSEVVEVLV